MTVSLEEMAQIQSEIDAGRERDAVLSAATLTDSSWQEAKLEWLEAMSAELARGRSLLLNRYGKAFVQHRAMLDAKKATNDKAANAARDRASAAQPVLVDERKIDLPSFLAKDQEIGGPVTTAPITAPLMSAPPSTAPMPEVPAGADGASLKETSSLDLSAIIGSLPLPFQASAPAQKTLPDASASGPSSRATPFAKPPDKPLDKPLVEIPRPPSAPPLGVETAALDFASIQDQVAQIIAGKGRALPFEPSSPLPNSPLPNSPLPNSPLPNSPLPNSKVSAPSSSAAAPAPRVASLAQTAFSAGNTGGTPLPFASPVASPGARMTRAPLDWTIDRYAALSIDLATTEGSREAVLAAYKVTTADHQALATYWQERLTDPAVGAQWKAACERYRATRAQHPKR